MPSRDPSDNVLGSFRIIAMHVAITVLAVGIAFTLPTVARYILFQWWPKVQTDAQLLLLTEIGLAAVLVLLFHMVRFTWNACRQARFSAIASLVHARDTRDGWLGRLTERVLMRTLPWKRDLLIMAITGGDTFAGEGAELHEALKDCHEVRAMLLNPHCPGARSRAKSLGDAEEVIGRFFRETAASIAYLGRLHASGRKIFLKLYEDPPFWKLVFAGDQVWVQYCHDGRDTKECPEYVFALQPDRPERGFFPAFFAYFLDHWNDPRHPEYNFDTSELVYRDREGAELRRLPFPGQEGRPNRETAGRGG